MILLQLKVTVSKKPHWILSVNLVLTVLGFLFLLYIYISEYVLTSAIVWTAVTSLGQNQSLDAIIEVDV